MCKKVIIFGFPHSGTTILRNIISHIENVFDIVDEVINIDDHLNDYSSYKFVVCKYPYLINEDSLLTEYSDYFKIFLIRNPLYVFSSLNKRFEYQSLDLNHSIEKYINTVKEFNKFKQEAEAFRKNYITQRKVPLRPQIVVSVGFFACFLYSWAT